MGPYREYEWTNITLVGAVRPLGLTCNLVTNVNLLLGSYIPRSGLTWAFALYCAWCTTPCPCGTCHLIYHCAWHYTSSTNCPTYRVTPFDLCWFLRKAWCSLEQKLYTYSKQINYEDTASCNSLLLPFTDCIIIKGFYWNLFLCLTMRVNLYFL